ncbi:hypothetical protein FACS1894110_09800 [Spirochaetia bacterium]|nr:hypothetical protein FACS1894110_09800 [Spirochaetia bacterium]
MNEKLLAIHAAYADKWLNEKANITPEGIKALNDLYGKPIPEPGTAESIAAIYSLENNAARIRIDGPLSIEGPDVFDKYYGYAGTSYIDIIGAIEKANTDPMAQNITLDISSPGGNVDGIFEAAEAVRTSAKPVTAVGSGMVASAAYWLASQAENILAANPITEFGSVGVVVAGYDTSGLGERMGVKRVTITSSRAPDKHADIGTEKGQSILKSRIDAMERHFFSAVARGRHVTEEHIAENFGKGGLLIALDYDQSKPSALSSGMIDGLQKTPNGPQATSVIYSQNTVSTPAAAGENNTPAPAGTRENAKMTLAELLAADPSAKVEFDGHLAAAEKNGREKAESDAKAIFAKCKVAFDNEAYAGLRDLALKVISGESKIEALEASYANADMFAEKEKSLLAQIETLKTGSVPGQAPDLSATPESKAMDAAGMQALEEAKKRKEAQGKWQ